MNVKRLAAASSLALLLLASAPAARADGMDNPIGGPVAIPLVGAVMPVVLTSVGIATTVL